MSTAKRKQSRWQPGMTYAIPLADGTFGIAQAGEAMWPNVIYVTLFSDRFLQLPTTPVKLGENAAVSLAATWKQALNRGEWPSLEPQSEVFRKSDFPNERFASNGYIGAMNYDAGILTKFLSAYHGMVPWNAMFDPTYYDKLLRSGLKRPSGALILDETAREKYRREVMGINTERQA